MTQQLFTKVIHSFIGRTDFEREANAFFIQFPEVMCWCVAYMRQMIAMIKRKNINKLLNSTKLIINDHHLAIAKLQPK